MEPLSARTHRLTAIEGVFLGVLLSLLAYIIGNLIGGVNVLVF